MKAKLITVFSALILATGFASRAWAQTVTKSIHVQNETGNLIAGATVYGMVLTQNGPDAAKTKVGITDSNGDVTLSLTDNAHYNFFAVKHTFLPNLKDQVFNPEHPMNFSAGTLAVSTITISSSGVVVADIGEVVGTVSGASANALLFGNLSKNSNNQHYEVDFGICLTDGAGACDLYMVNIPTAAANTYQMSAFDPQGGKSGECLPQAVDSALLSTHRSSATLNFTTCGVSARKGDSGGGGDASQGTVSVEGVVTDTTTAQNSVSFVGLSFDYYDANFKSTNTVWSHADQNGRFQLYGLTSGVTYYSNVFGGCGAGGCYEGHNSTRTSLFETPGTNDFLYTGTQKIVRLQLNALSTADTANLAVYVKNSNGALLPDSHINIGSDWRTWDQDGDGACDESVWNAGQAHYNQRASTGYVNFSNLPLGNYRVNVWSQFSNQPVNFNDGPNNSEANTTCGSDDLRITVSSNPVAVNVYDGQGVAVYTNISSVTVSINTASNATGLLKGKLTFPQAVDLSAAPITIILRGECGNNGCTPGGVAILNGASSLTHDYTINVASGSTYETRIVSGFWARSESHGGFHSANFKSTDTITLDMTMVPAGKVEGTLKKPDGSVFRPTQSGNSFSGAWVNAGGDCGWGGSEVTSAGTFSIDGLKPCKYKLRVYGWGSFPYADAKPLPEVTVEANRITNTDVRLVDGIPVVVTVDTGTLPNVDKQFVFYGTEKEELEKWAVQVYEPGTVFTQANLLDMLTGDSDQDAILFISSYTGNGRCNQNWPGGWCPKRVAVGTYDMYLMRRGDFRTSGTGDSYSYFVIHHSSKNIIVKSDNATVPVQLNGSSVTAVSVHPSSTTNTSARGNHTLEGDVTASNIFRRGDFDDLGGSFDNFMKYIPVVMLYDADGALIGGGMVTPTPAVFQSSPTLDTNIDKSVANKDYDAFSQVLTDFGSWHYQIKGLAPGLTGTAVFTTPNYPPLKKAFTLANTDKSTTTLAVNFDSEVGAGSTLSGVIRTTSSVVVPRASVQLEAEAYPARTKEASSVGAYSFPGLPAGSYKLTVTAADFIPKVTRVAVGSGQSITQDVALKTGGGVITGTVYKEQFPFPRFANGAQLYCYDETFAGANSTSEVTLFKVRTSTAGYYRIANLIPGDSYRCSVKLKGKYILHQTTTAVEGTRTGFDFFPTDKPPRINVSCKAFDSTAKVSCRVSNPSDFADGSAWFHYSTNTFNRATDPEVSDSANTGDTSSGDNDVVLNIPYTSLADGINYTLHIEAITASTKKVVTRSLQFSKENKDGTADKDIDDAMLGDSEDPGTGVKPNEVCMDSTGGNASCMQIPVGGLLPISSGAIPSLKFGSVDVNASTVAAKVLALGTTAFLSGIYNLEVSSINFTGRGVDICLSYSQGNSSLADVGVHTYNSTAQKWELVTGQQTINAGKGTICTRIGDFSGTGVAAAPGGDGGLRVSGALRTAGGGYALAGFNGQNYVVQAAGSSSGSFAVIKPSLTTGNAYTESTFKVYNFPNPFNLDNKTVALKDSATTSVATSGTVIKLEVPSTVSGDATIRIYTLAGELVRELSLPGLLGGKYYYATWDGRNSQGAKVADAVYYGIVNIAGVTAKNATFKLAVIK